MAGESADWRAYGYGPNHRNASSFRDGCRAHFGIRHQHVYTPLAIVIAVLAWASSGDALRFLGVLVVATPCPLLIAIPVAIIGSVSLAARRGIIIKDPAALEKIDTCRIAIFDKTGTLTYGQPKLTEVLPAAGFTREATLAAVASLERYSRHPLASAMLDAATQAKLPFQEAGEVSERPGEGLRGVIGGRTIQVTSRKKLSAQSPAAVAALPPLAGDWSASSSSTVATRRPSDSATNHAQKASHSFGI